MGDKLIQNLREMRYKEVLFLGSSGGGKSSIVQALVDDDRNLKLQVEGRQFPQVNIQDCKFTLIDMTDQNARKLHYAKAKAFVIVIDSTDQESIQHGKEILDEFLNNMRYKDKVILVLGNKMDQVGSLSEKELRESLDINSDLVDSNRVGVFISCATKGIGLLAAFGWLSKSISHQKQIYQKKSNKKHKKD
ncbi:cps1 protein [Stylonychia lemnae]|uniref:Cps1 protein n=1 Tax=Stylonychia lemnae TaxID=5949 RepID=A0A077ZWX4_STYLE|nr:cps1 protein [Stylonychia lemnae]|eukprot:CDW73001.1 cps1 protein [Stylonychia lemnae]